MCGLILTPYNAKYPGPLWGRDILARDKGFEPLTFWSVVKRTPCNIL